MSVGIHMDSGEGKLEPDPVRAVYSVQEGVAFEYEQQSAPECGYWRERLDIYLKTLLCDPL